MTPETLRAFRRAEGYTQQRLACALDVSTRTIEDWEAGRRTPPVYLALALAALRAGLPAYTHPSRA